MKNKRSRQTEFVFGFVTTRPIPYLHKKISGITRRVPIVLTSPVAKVFPCAIPISWLLIYLAYFVNFTNQPNIMELEDSKTRKIPFMLERWCYIVNKLIMMTNKYFHYLLIINMFYSFQHSVQSMRKYCRYGPGSKNKPEKVTQWGKFLTWILV